MKGTTSSQINMYQKESMGVVCGRCASTSRQGESLYIISNAGKHRR